MKPLAKILLRIPIYALVVYLIGCYVAGKMGYLKPNKKAQMSFKALEPTDNLLQRLRNELLELTLECRQWAAKVDKDANTVCFSNYAYFELSQNTEMDQLAQPYRQIFDAAINRTVQLLRPANTKSFSISSLEERFKAIIPGQLDAGKIVAEESLKGQIDEAYQALKARVINELSTDLQNYLTAYKEKSKPLEFFQTQQIEQTTKNQFERFLVQHDSNADFNDEREDSECQKLIQTKDLPERLKNALEKYNRRGRSTWNKFLDIFRR